MTGDSVFDPADGLIGRTAELDHIASVLRTGGVLPIIGGRGSGRSRLLAVGARLGRAGDARRVVVARPAAAVLPQARQLLLAIRRDLPDLPGPEGAHALAFLDPAADATPADPARLVVDVFAALNRRRPTVIVADDVDRRPGPVAALLCGLPGSVLLAADESRLPAALAGRPAVRLAPLSPQDSVRLLDSRPYPPTGRARAEILRRAGGNPAALVELGRGGRQQDAFAAAVADLPEPSRRLLLHLAAATPPVDAHTVAEAAGLSGPAAWRDAERAGLVVRSGGMADFVHPLAAEAAYWTATAHLRSQAHRNLAAVLDATPERQALHLAAAVDGPDETLAAELEAAAAAFRARGETFEAATALHRAAERSPRPVDAARRLAAAAVDACELGAVEWTTDLYTEVRHRTDDPGVIAWAAGAAARALSRSGRQHEAYRVISAARRAGSTALLGPATAITVITGRAEHRRNLARMLAEAGPGLDPLLADLVRIVADPGARSGRAVRSPAPVPPAHAALALAGSIAVFEDRTQAAADLLQAVVDDHTERRAPATAEAVPDLVGALIDTGRWDLAEDHAEAPMPIGLPVAAAHLDALRAHLHALRGNAAEALRLVRRTWTRLDIEQHRAIHVRLLRAAGLAASADGDYDDAYRYLRSMFDRDGRPLQILAGRGIAELVAAAVRCGRVDDVRPVVDLVRAQSGHSRPTTRMRLLLHAGEALLAGGEQAEQHFRSATDDPAGQEWPYERAVARMHYGEWLRRNRRPRDARAVLTAAAQVFEALGAKPAAALTARELQAAGHETGTRLGVLTPQEQEVARLAARGLRNREIGERLFISARTVGAHLQRIYPKLGITRRHELHSFMTPS